MPSCAGVSSVNRSRLSPLSFARVFDQFGFGLRWTFIGRSALGQPQEGSRRAYVFRIASNSCRKRVLPALTFSATSGHSLTVRRIADFDPLRKFGSEFSMTEVGPNRTWCLR